MFETKITFRFYSEYDTKGITGFLNTMAVKGWLLEKRSGAYYRFVKTDKAFVKYDITYFADANKENNFLPYGADRYFEMAKAAGWQFVTNDNKMMIFVSENPDAPPLETEPMMKVDVIHQSFMYLWMPLYLLHGVNGLIRLIDKRIDIYDILLIAGAFGFLYDLYCYLVWYFKAKKAAAEGWYLETKTPFVRMYVTPIILLLMLGMLYKIIGIKAGIFCTAIALIYIIAHD